MRDAQWQEQKELLERQLTAAAADLLMHVGGAPAIMEIRGGASAHFVGVGKSQELIELMVLRQLEAM